MTYICFPSPEIPLDHKGGRLLFILEGSSGKNDTGYLHWPNIP